MLSKRLFSLMVLSCLGVACKPRVYNEAKVSALSTYDALGNIVLYQVNASEGTIYRSVCSTLPPSPDNCAKNSEVKMNYEIFKTQLTSQIEAGLSSSSVQEYFQEQINDLSKKIKSYQSMKDAASLKLQDKILDKDTRAQINNELKHYTAMLWGYSTERDSFAKKMSTLQQERLAMANETKKNLAITLTKLEDSYPYNLAEVSHLPEANVVKTFDQIFQKNGFPTVGLLHRDSEKIEINHILEFTFNSSIALSQHRGVELPQYFEDDPAVARVLISNGKIVKNLSGETAYCYLEPVGKNTIEPGDKFKAAVRPRYPHTPILANDVYQDQVRFKIENRIVFLCFSQNNIETYGDLRAIFGALVSVK